MLVGTLYSIFSVFEIFIHSLKYDKEMAWGCDLCPKPLDIKSGMKEEDFDDIECHISDGINMGTIENDIKGVTEKEIFEQQKDESRIVKGIEAKDRTLINNAKHRKIVHNLCLSAMSSAKLTKAISRIEASK